MLSADSLSHSRRVEAGQPAALGGAAGPVRRLPEPDSGVHPSAPASADCKARRATSSGNSRSTWHSERTNNNRNLGLRRPGPRMPEQRECRPMRRTGCRRQPLLRRSEHRPTSPADSASRQFSWRSSRSCTFFPHPRGVRGHPLVCAAVRLLMSAWSDRRRVSQSALCCDACGSNQKPTPV